jgi:hypothetical protein
MFSQNDMRDGLAVRNAPAKEGYGTRMPHELVQTSVI